MNPTFRLVLKVFAGFAALAFIFTDPFSAVQAIAFWVSIPVFILATGLLVIDVQHTHP